MGLRKIPISPSSYWPWNLEKCRCLLLLQVQPVGEASSEARCVMSLLQLSPPNKLWDLEIFRSLVPHIGLGIWKNSELSLGLWDLVKFRALPFYIGSGIQKNFGLFSSFKYSLQAKHRAERGARCHSSNGLLHEGSGTWKNSDLSSSM